MKVYIVMYDYHNDTDYVAVYRTREDARAYVDKQEAEYAKLGMSGCYSVIEEELK